MLTVSFQPKTIFFGFGALGKVEEAVHLLRGLRPLIVADGGIAKAGLPGKIAEALGSRTSVYSEFSGEPNIHLTEELAKVVRTSRFDVVIGVGGGSSLDAAKIASILATNTGGVLSYLDAPRPNPPLPKILLPTTAGSGSETSSFAVFRCDDGVKRYLYGPDVVADVAIIDPALTRTCPRPVAAASGVDALSTGMEAYLSKLHSPLSDLYAVETVELCHRFLVRAVKDADDDDALSGMSLAASLSGVAASTPAAVNIGHCIAETVGPLYDIPHGKAVAATLPYMVEFNKEACRERLQLLARRLELDDAQAIVNWLKATIKEVGLPSGFRHMGVPRADLPKLAELVFKKRQYECGLPDVNPAPVTEAGVIELIRKSWAGE